MRDPSASLLLLTPAALNQRRSRPVLERVRALGFTPFRHRVHARLAPDVVTSVFQVNRHRIWDTYRYRVLDRLFQAGPSAAVLAAPAAGTSAAAAGAELAGAVGALGFLEDGGAPGLPLVYVSPSPERRADDEAALFEPDDGERSERPEELALALDLVESGSPRAELDRDAVLARLRAAALLGAWGDLDDEGRRRVEATLDGGPGLAAREVAEPLVAHLRGGERHLLADFLRHDFDRTRRGFAWWRQARVLALYGAEPSIWDELVLLGGMVER